MIEGTALEATVINFVKEQLNKASGCHDWWHIERVYKLAMRICSEENGNRTIVMLGALLHDIADSKFHNGDETIGPRVAKVFLEEHGVDSSTVEQVLLIIQHISFKGGNFNQTYHSKELDIVQDADRLDAIGAIGIGRAFSYGGLKNRAMYEPNIPPNLSMTKEEYKKSTAPTINHFYEKLLLLKERMNTETGKIVAQERHNFMESFLTQFYKEWEGK